MKKPISTLVLTYRHCQSMRMTKAKPSEAEAAESEFSLSVILVDERKEEAKTLVLSNALAKLVVKLRRTHKISGNGEWVKKKVVEIASDMGASCKEVELGENAE